jgi:uncharacterized protein (DUF1499 family)
MTDYLDLKTIQRPSSPNTAFYAPADYATSSPADAAAPIYDVAPGELYVRLLRVLKERDAWVLDSQDPESMRVHFVAVSPLMRFKDDVDVTILPVSGSPGKSTFAAYSRSRVGYSDLGANRKRLDALAAALAAP